VFLQWWNSSRCSQLRSISLVSRPLTPLSRANLRSEADRSQRWFGQRVMAAMARQVVVMLTPLLATMASMRRFPSALCQWPMLLILFISVKMP
jgi:hypothetical protein